MFVNGAKATEAAGILDIDLEGLTSKGLTDAYRQQAKLSHPDVEGSDTLRWEKVAWAKQVLTRWLEMRVEAKAPAGGPRGNCRACAGLGHTQRRSGFTLGPRMRCVLCEGSGNVKKHDRED